MTTPRPHAEEVHVVLSSPAPLGEPPAQFETLPDAPAPSADGGLGKRAAMGFMLMSGQSILTRVISFGSQIVLARVMTLEQFGLFGLAMSIVNYANLAQQVGVREILVSRHKRFDLWASTGFWVATVTGIISMLLILGAAPIAGWFYSDRTLVWMLLVLALAQPTYNMTLVQEAKLQVHLRFKYIALCQFVWGALTPLAQLAFALLKFGALAFVLPRLISGLIRWWMYARAEPITISRRWRVRRWKFVLYPGLTLLLTSLALTISPTVPAMMLGRFIDKASTGYFTFAYNLSLQVLMLLSMQIDSVLFPTLGRMGGDPDRQRAAILRSSRALTAVMAPFCFLQAAAAGPAIALLFGLKWQPALEPLQIMSIGVLGSGGYASAQSLLMAQGRFREKLLISITWATISSAASVAGIFLVPAQDAVSAAAFGLSIGSIGYGFHSYVASTKCIGGGARDALRVILLPCVLGGSAAALAWWASTAVEPLAQHVAGVKAHAWILRTLELGVIGFVGLGVYVLLLRLIARGLWQDLASAGAPILRRLRLSLPV